MHQTTVRFTPDLWESLELECRRLGISAAQYLREAALARLAYMAGQRGDTGYERALVTAGATLANRTSGAAEERHAMDAMEARVAKSESSAQGLAAAAVSAQSEHVRRRAQEIRAQAEALRRRRREKAR